MSGDRLELRDPWRHPVFEELRLENARLRRDNHRLRDALAPSYRFPRRWDLTAQEVKVLSALYAQAGCVVYARLGAAMSRRTETCLPRHIRVVIARIRAKTEAFGVEIECYRGIGYGLTVEGRAVVRAALVGGGT